MVNIVIIFAIANCLILSSICDPAVSKREIYNSNFGNGFATHNGFNGVTHGTFNLFSPVVKQDSLVEKVAIPVSPAEIAAAISAAREASAQVLRAQERVEAAKEAVIREQRIASLKEAKAALLAQKAEAAAAAQRQEANSAASAVVMAQRRLAQAKADVAEQQREAATREAHAAHIIGKSASAAAVEIAKSEQTAGKLAALKRGETLAFKHASAAKEASISAASAAVAAETPHYAHHHVAPAALQHAGVQISSPIGWSILPQTGSHQAFVLSGFQGGWRP